MNTFKKIVIASITAGTIALGGTAIADRGDGEGRSAKMVERISKRLELDDNQSAALQSLADTMKASRQAARGGDEGAGRGAAVLQFIEGDTLDQGAALAALEARAEAMRVAAPELVAAAATFYDGLDVEQQEQAREFLEKGGRRSGRR